MSIVKSSLIALIASGLGAATPTYPSGASASSTGYGSSPSSSSYADCPLNLAENQFIQFGAVQATISQVNKDQAFLQPQDLHIMTPNDLDMAVQFTIPDFSAGGKCAFVLSVPTAEQNDGDLNQAVVSSAGGLVLT